MFMIFFNFIFFRGTMFIKESYKNNYSIYTLCICVYTRYFITQYPNPDYTGWFKRPAQNVPISRDVMFHISAACNREYVIQRISISFPIPSCKSQLLAYQHVLFGHDPLNHSVYIIQYMLYNLIDVMHMHIYREAEKEINKIKGLLTS